MNVFIVLKGFRKCRDKVGNGWGVKLGYSYNSKEFFPGHFTSGII